MNLGDKVIFEHMNFTGWVGEIVKELQDDLVLVKWDPTYTLSEGLVHRKNNLKLADQTLKVGRQ